MGYYTYRKLSVYENGTKIDSREHIDNIEKQFSEYLDGESKWYDCYSDMKGYSTKYPNLIFVIEGKGEEHDDIWRAKWQNGKMSLIEPELVWPKWPKME